jgi:hypothetical protein
MPIVVKVDFRYPLGIPAYYAARVIALHPYFGCRSTLVRRFVAGMSVRSKHHRQSVCLLHARRELLANVQCYCHG